MDKRILVPLDGSEFAETVLPLCCTISRACQAEIVVINIPDYPYEIYKNEDERITNQSYFMQFQNKSENLIWQRKVAYLNQIAGTLESRGLTVITEVFDGPVVESILDAAERFEVAMIILSAWGEGGGSFWSLGSTASRVLRKARVPVILHKPAAGHKGDRVNQHDTNQLADDYQLSWIDRTYPIFGMCSR